MGTDTRAPPKLPEDVCPNCFRGGRLGCLMISETSVKHCGCYYEADPNNVVIHFDRDPGRAEHEVEKAHQQMMRCAAALADLHARQASWISALSSARHQGLAARNEVERLRRLAEEALRRLYPRSP